MEKCVTAEEAIYRYSDMVYRTAFSVTKNRADAEDVMQDGAYLSSRAVGGTLYLVTNRYFYFSQAAERNYPTYVPVITDASGSHTVPAEDIMLFGKPKSNAYTVVGGIDTVGFVSVSAKALLGYGGKIYSNAESLYVLTNQTAQAGGMSYNATNIVRLSFDTGEIEFCASAEVKGVIHNSFSVDDDGQHLRIVTTVDTWSSGSYVSSDVITHRATYLYVLDKNLRIVGQTDAMAPGERVYSVRFLGDTAYVVTYLQIDPLFTVDLKNPAVPVVTGELKSPGFSDYLHPYGEGLLFGLGKTDDGEIKLSMFGISDPENVTEEHTVRLENFMYSEASYNHKAILISPEKKLIGFAALGWQYQSGYAYNVYSYSDGFRLCASVYASDTDRVRGLYVSDCLYVVSDDGITVMSLSDFSVTAQLAL